MLLPSRRILLLALIGLSLALTGWFAYRAGVREGVRVASGSSATREALARDVADARLERHALALDSVRRERDIARATIDTLRGELERGGELLAEERAELELYRRVSGSEFPTGLAIDALERRAGPPAVLAITLVQARGRDRVDGRIDVSAANRDGTALVGVDGAPAWSASFDLRFFQTLEVPVKRLGEPFPEAVLVAVVPEGGRHRPFRRLFGRETIRTVD